MVNGKPHNPYLCVSSPEKWVCPYAPAGGGGGGYFRQPGPILDMCLPLGIPHPESPAFQFMNPSALDKINNCNTFRSKKPWYVSNKLLKFLATWENGLENGVNFDGQIVVERFMLTVYNDSRNIPTVGCGHRVIKSDNLKIGDKITYERAQSFLKSDLIIAEKFLNKNVTIPLYVYEYDALVDTTFNCGVTGVSELINLVNIGDYEAIPDRIKTYKVGHGNIKRRASEANLFRYGIYDASH